MRTKSGLWVAVLALLSFLAVMAPQQAHADAAPIASAAGVQVPAPLSTTDCPSGNAIDTAYNQNSSNFQQQLSQAASNLNTLFPIAPALNACMTNIMQAFQKLPGLGSPISFVASAVTSLLTSIIGQVCSQVMGVITQAQAAITNMTKICIPLPQFNLALDLPAFAQTSCTGGTQFSPLTSFSSTNARPTNGYSQYLH